MRSDEIRAYMEKKTMNISELKDGDKVVTERGTGFVKNFFPVLGIRHIRICLDGGEAVKAIDLDIIEVVS